RFQERNDRARRRDDGAERSEGGDGCGVRHRRRRGGLLRLLKPATVGQTSTTRTIPSRPVKSSRFRVYRSRPLAWAVAAINRSANRRRGFLEVRTTAATTSP